MKKRIAVALTSSALLAAPTGQPADRSPASSPLQARPPGLSAAQLAALSKAEIKKLLARIEQAKTPEPKMGAMCYSPMPVPDRMDYVCPACGEKTLHARETALTWHYELQECRRLFGALPKRNTMVLDESSFCRKCRPGTAPPALRLQLRFDDGTTNVVANIRADDLRMLKAFLSGEFAWQTSNEGASPLKKHLPRLQELLGVKP